jgi:hypothetical protein
MTHSRHFKLRRRDQQRAAPFWAAPIPAGSRFGLEQQAFGIGRIHEKGHPPISGVEVPAGGVDSQGPGAELRRAAGDDCGAGLAGNLAGVRII